MVHSILTVVFSVLNTGLYHAGLLQRLPTSGAGDGGVASMTSMRMRDPNNQQYNGEDERNFGLDVHSEDATMRKQGREGPISDVMMVVGVVVRGHHFLFFLLLSCPKTNS